MNKIALASFLLFSSFFKMLFAEEQIDQEQGLEMLCFLEIPIVVTATLSDEQYLNAPASMSVVSESQIINRGYRSLAEALRDVVSISTDLYNQNGIYLKTRANIDGVNSKILIDGISVNDPLFDSGIRWYDMPLENVKQIEIIRGPGGALYGTGAMEGVINIITKKNLDKNNAVVTVEGGNEDYQKYDLFFNYRNPDKNSFITLDANYLHSNQSQLGLEFDPITMYDPATSKAPGYYEQSLLRKQIYASAGFMGFEAHGFYVDSKDQMYMPAGVLVDDAPFENKKAMGDLRYPWVVSDSFKVTPKIQYQSTDWNFDGQYYPQGFFVPFDSNGDGNFEYWPNGVLQEVHMKTISNYEELLFEYSSDKWNLKTGLFYHDIDMKMRKDRKNYDPVFFSALDSVEDFTNTFPSLPDSTRELKGLFIQSVYNPIESTSLIVSGRYDDYSDIGSRFTPRAGITYQFDRGIIKLLYQEAFRAPKFDELYFQSPAYVGNQDLKPFIVDTTEFFLHYQFLNMLSYSGTVYYSHLKDGIGSFINSYGQETNVNMYDIQYHGVENELTLSFEKIKFFLNYSYLDAEELIKIKTLGYPVENLFKAGFDVKVSENISGYLSWVYEGKIERPNHFQGDLSANEDFNIGLCYLKNPVKINFTLYNVFDSENYYSGYTNQTSDILKPGRTFTVKGTYEF